jgi:formamidopyrimidine-DNA glycosylase
MPELPEVEYAARLAREVAVGRTVRRVRVLHRAQRKALPPARSRRLAGEVVTALERRGKYQVLRFQSGRALVVHFRLNGDWGLVAEGERSPVHTRVVIWFDRGPALALVDSRALATVSLHDAGARLLPELGPEANTAAFSVAWLRDWFARRRGPVKPALLDQRAVAGIGNIYASEALWYAGVDPRRRANTLSLVELRHVVAGVRRAMRKALEHPERYYGANGVSDGVRFNVYDREGRPCRRCGAPIRRIVQSGRGTYYCGTCQG